MLGRELAIGSVFTGFGAKWYRNQMDFLRKTTDVFDHFVFLNRAEPDAFQFSVVVGMNNDEESEGFSIGNHQHILGMNALGEFFRSRRYRRYLLLDSDCFPVVQGWKETLDGMLGRTGKKFAAPVRYEELSSFPHPSAIYSSDPEVFRFHMSDTRDILGNQFWDTLMVNEEGVLPLVRTNFWSMHPLIGSVYGGMFYHHGAGSRHFTSHAFNMHYYDHIDMPDSHEVLREFDKDPAAYVAKSAGRPL
jgi:hypothetical protein